MDRLFVHEVYRVFYDRLVDDEDRKWLFVLSKQIVKEQFRESFDGLFTHLAQPGQSVSRKIFDKLKLNALNGCTSFPEDF